MLGRAHGNIPWLGSTHGTGAVRVAYLCAPRGPPGKAHICIRRDGRGTGNERTESYHAEDGFQRFKLSTTPPRIQRHSWK